MSEAVFSHSHGFVELKPYELYAVDGGGDFSWGQFFGAVGTGAVVGGLGGAAVGGIGAVPGAVGGGLLGGIAYCISTLF